MNIITELEKLAEKWPHEEYTVSGLNELPDRKECFGTCHRCQLAALIEQAKAEPTIQLGDKSPNGSCLVHHTALTLKGWVCEECESAINDSAPSTVLAGTAESQPSPIEQRIKELIVHLPSPVDAISMARMTGYSESEVRAAMNKMAQGTSPSVEEAAENSLVAWCNHLGHPAIERAAYKAGFLAGHAYKERGLADDKYKLSFIEMDLIDSFRGMSEEEKLSASRLLSGCAKARASKESR